MKVRALKFFGPAIFSGLIVAALSSPAQSQDYIKPVEPTKYRLSDDVRKNLRASGEDVQLLNRQLLTFIDGTCPNPFVPCRCTFEGFQAPCSFVLSCLSSGLCVADN